MSEAMAPTGDEVPAFKPALSDTVVPTLASLSLQSSSSSSTSSSAISDQQEKSLNSSLSSDTSTASLPQDGSTPAISIAPQPLPASTSSSSSASAAGSTHDSAEAAKIAAIKSRDFASPVKAAAPPVKESSSSSIAGTQVNGVDSSSSTSTPTPSATTAADATAGVAAASTTPAPAPVATGGTASPIPRSNTASPRPPLPISSSTPAIRRPGQGGQGGGLAARIPPSLQAKMAAMASRSSNPTSHQFAQTTHLGSSERLPTSSLLRQTSSGAQPSSSGPSLGGSPILGPQGVPGRPLGGPGGAPGRIGAMGPISSAGRASPGVGGMARPGVPGALGGMAKRRGPQLNLANINGGSGDDSTGGVSSSSSSSSSGTPNGGVAVNGKAGRPPMRLPSGGNGATPTTGTPFSNFSKIVDPSGSLNFENKAVLHAKGVDFTSGASFKINMDELELQEELGSGNYGTVKKVYHKVTKVTMAMKEIRLELDDSKLKGIITELDILHRATAPEIVEFYGAFFIESCVYYCMEYMDALSLDKLSVIDVPEPVLARVTGSMVRGLKFLKDHLQIMHRDVKPTNVLVNTAGLVKLCDFGVSGQLERSLAKTNIGCQSYMAPERIKGESQNFLGTYTVSSDVWSLGLSLIEFTLGRYPYPPETFSNVFAQLTAIVHGDPPTLPRGFSPAADDFVLQCLQKEAHKRPTYAMLLRHPFLANEADPNIDMVGWVKAALEKRTQLKAAGVAPPEKPPQ